MSPAVRAWLGQRTTIQGVAIVVGATVWALSGKLSLDAYTAALSAAGVMIGLPEAPKAAVPPIEPPA